MTVSLAGEIKMRFFVFFLVIITSSVAFGGTPNIPPAAPGLQPQNNLSDVANTATSRTNLGLGTAVTTLPSISALHANTTAGTSRLFVTGYYSLADGGEGFFTLNPSDTTSSDNGGTIIVDAAGNRWYRESNGAPVINVKQFGAKGAGSSHDDTAAIQAAVTYAISAYTTNGIQATVYFPTPTSAYYVTSPINCTSSSVSYGLSFRGDGKRNTIIEGELSSPGPVFDWSGQASGQIVDLMITSTSSGSLATTAILFASTTASHTNYNNVVERVQVVMTNNSVVAGITAQDADLLAISHSYVSVNNSSTNAAIAFSGGGALPSGVSSTFQTANATVDQTDYRITNSWLTGNLAADFTGGSGWTFVNTYAAVVGTINSDNAIIRLNAPTSTIDINMRAFNLRTENQSSSTGVIHAIYSKGNTPIFGIGIFGKSELNINPSTGGDFIKIDNGAAASEPVDLDLDFFAASGAYPLFNVVAGNVRRVGGESNVTTAPIMASGSYVGSWSHVLIEGPDISTFLAAHLVGRGVNGNAGFAQRASLPYDARVRYMTGVSGSLSNVNGYNYGSWWSTTAYTGGSGTQIVETFTIPAGMLVGESLVGSITRKLEAHFHGATTQANTTVGIQLRQGGGTYVLGTATMASASALDMNLIVDNRITAKGIYFSGIMTAGLATVLNALTTAAYGNIDPTSDFFLDITASSAGNNPFNTSTHSIVID